ncbi:MAG: hypothetical protein EAZ81_05765 [Verrucomicrobia bacterium]|nr:MAG: hypothetical protein EAZ81_05765 [Verrucomicrobiota bacterium]
MSLHAQLSPEAAARLAAMQRQSTLTSIIISFLVILLLGLLLAFILIAPSVKEVEMVVAYTNPKISEEKVDTPKPTTRPQQKPAAAPAARSMVIAAATTSSLAIPQMDAPVSEPTIDFGSANDFGEGLDSFGDGQAAGGGGGFGSANQASGGLKGSLYDFKQKPNGKPIAYDLGNPNEYIERVLRLQRSRYSDAALRRHFEAPNSLYLTHLAIPFSLAAEGPGYFGAKDLIQPSGWVAHYRGRVKVPKTGEYRFSGLGDDYLVVLVDGKVRLVGSWSDIQPAVANGWTPTEPTGKHASPFHNVRLVYGDWIKLREGQEIDVQIALGERPGGYVGYLLHIEEKSASYRNDANGRPILPLFTTAPFAPEERERLTKAFGSYEFEWDQVPIFFQR